ncbi:Hypothetical protein, putative [Bodo saltans]|uniref:Uncharacterized protein n=1 Tax=Bodo saltans TaxID=75058 RepID=A0A0S4IIJ9_BODSA|nr:Hypothetical protein, putative [Bodo saltans]|eukprot:CUE72170.1 Hypothetical protein, putative [Bodo saltans]
MSNKMLLAHLEADARKMETGEDKIRALSLIFQQSLHEEEDSAFSFSSAATTRHNNDNADDSEASPPKLLCFGLKLLHDVYNDECCVYLEKGGVYELLDALAVSNVAHPLLRDAVVVVASSSRDGAAAGGSSSGAASPMHSSAVDHNSPGASFIGGGASLSNSPAGAGASSSGGGRYQKGQQRLDPTALTPTLPLTRFVESWRLFHPMQHHSRDTIHKRAFLMYKELVSDINSNELLARLESLMLFEVAPPHCSFRGTATTAALAAASSGVSAGGGGNPSEVAAMALSTSNGDVAGLATSTSMIRSSAPPSSSVCVLNGEFDEDAEALLSTLGKLERRVFDLSMTLKSIEEEERSLLLYPWSITLQTSPEHYLAIPPKNMAEAVKSMQLVVQAAQRTYKILKMLSAVDEDERGGGGGGDNKQQQQQLFGPQSWILCLNENLKFHKKPTTCAAVPALVKELSKLLHQLRAVDSRSPTAALCPHVRWMTTQSDLIRSMCWVRDAWETSYPYLVYLQRLLIAQVETFTFVMSDDGDGPVRQVTTTPTTRVDRLASQRRSIVAWGALCFRKSFMSWEDLRWAPLHRIAQQLKKLDLPNKNTLSVMHLIFSQLDLGTHVPEAREGDVFDEGGHGLMQPFGPMHASLRSFLNEELAAFSYEQRDAKFASTTVRRGK